MNLLGLIDLLITALQLLIVSRTVLNLLFPTGGGQVTTAVMNILYKVTEPMLAPIRRIVYKGGPFDFSPMVAILLLIILGWVF